MGQCATNFGAVPDRRRREQKRTLGVLQKLQVATKKQRGSAGYELCRRNKIRSLIRRKMNAHGRATFVASHPDAVARAFDAQIKTFLDVAVRYGKGGGLFGDCKAYCGTVEAQGRGTLRCRMLLWLEGNPNPQQLRGRMVDFPDFRDAVFSWKTPSNASFPARLNR
ncbi:hypothetical protein EV363DRAFT_1178046 [Boletus edulis]|nr:hypothetical protein EV363DRAFT_1178046 [Boletus edulis]